MKQVYLLLISLCFAHLTQAQVSKNVELTPGTLSTVLTAEEKGSITNLTLTGIIDARDFKTMRDEMTVLAELDLGTVTIQEYWGLEGPANESITYDANAIPWYSFCFDETTKEGKISITAIILPAGITKIDGFAFTGCTGLTTFDFPPSLTVIGEHAFDSCSNLNVVTLPSSVTAIYDFTFNGCNSLSSITIPSSITKIERGAFNGCKQLRSITVESLLPIPLYYPEDTFIDVDKTSCTLHVPFGTRERYATATEWGDFLTITEEGQGFLISSNTLTFDVSGGSDSTVGINANTDWASSSDQSWLTVNPSSGNNSQTLTVTTQANVTSGARVGVITFSAPGIAPQTLVITQDSPMKTVDITPGGLKTALTEEEKASISDLTITGTMNATDFGTMNHEMPMLTKLDLSAVSIVSYTETSPSCRVEVTYPANTLPGIAPYCPTYKLKSLISLILPNSLTALGWYSLGGSGFSSIVIPPLVTSIGDEAFKGCEALTTITIPSSVTEFGLGVFSDCKSLTSIDLPPKINTVNDNTFTNCIALNSIELPSSVTSIGGDAFYGCSSLKEISLPPSLTSIGYEAFNGCSALTSVLIPSSVTNIDPWAFANCTNLRTIFIPPAITEIWPSVFNNCTSLSAIYFYRPTPPAIGLDNPMHGVDRSTCTLYVPYGSGDLYAEAEVWKDFSNIVEMSTLKLSETNVIVTATESSKATVEIISNVEWTASCDQVWLTVNPASGVGCDTITLIAEANTTNALRTATVTVLGTGADPQTIVITQVPLSTGLGGMEQIISQLTCYPNPFTQEVTIEIQNPTREKISVEIYNLAGQRVKNLADGNTSELLYLTWDGTNELEQQVPPGLYICKMNGQTMQVVKGR